MNKAEEARLILDDATMPADVREAAHEWLVEYFKQKPYIQLPPVMPYGGVPNWDATPYVNPHPWYPPGTWCSGTSTVET